MPVRNRRLLAKLHTLRRRPAVRQLLVAVMLALVGCSRAPESAEPAPTPQPAIADLPVQITLRQRSTATVPGSDPPLRLTIDDVTRGQVMASLAHEGGEGLLGPVSFTPGHSEGFRVGEAEYELSLTKLDNVLIGEDSATFVISEAGSVELSETGKIERLIAIIAAMEDAVFIRNGDEHSAEDAADHLRSKWRWKAGEIETAEQFIDEVATRSSQTGEPYRIRLPDGTVVPTGEYLRERLEQMGGSDSHALDH